MVTGIDETGDFDPNSGQFNYFVAVHLDQNKGRLAIKQSQFHKWESSIPDEYKTADKEIKGQKLPDKFLQSFSEEVLEIDPMPLYSVVRIRPNENPVEILEMHKELEIASIEKVIKDANEFGSHNWAEGYKQILYWYKNKNFQLLMKIKCLDQLLTMSLNRVIGYSQLKYLLDNEEMTNISRLEFKVDKDFVKAQNVKIIWGELFRQFWQQHSQKYPVPLINLWSPENHPVHKVFPYDDAGKINMTSVFRERTHFLDSKEHWEIRLADLVGTILHRYQNKGRCEVIAKKLLVNLSKKQNNYLHIALNEIQ